MNRIEELISRLCPDGVEFKTLGELGAFYGGLTGKSKSDFTNGNAKFITYKNIYSNPALNTDIEEKVLIKEGEKQNYVVYGDILFTGSSETPDECGISSVITKHIDEKLYLNSFCFGFRLNHNGIFFPDFLKHLFRSQNLRTQIGKTANGVTRFNVSKSKMAKISIPIPPLEIQQEIVRILDNFTELTNELTNELTARKKQYEYYRDMLLTFDKDDDKVKWMKLGEVLHSIKTGLNPRQFFKLNTPDATSYYVTIKEFVGGKLKFSNTTDRINETARMLCNNRSNLECNDVLFSGTGTIGETYVIEKEPLNWNIKEGVYSLKPKTDILSSKYLKYILSQSETKSQYLKLAEGGTVKSISMKKLSNFSIPIPSLEVQEKIVSILDRFDQLCNDLTAGLPAEIEARIKQYEYYRDKLLTFKEKEA